MLCRASFKEKENETSDVAVDYEHSGAIQRMEISCTALFFSYINEKCDLLHLVMFIDNVTQSLWNTKRL